MADAYRIKDQYNAYFITLTIIDWVDVFTLNHRSLSPTTKRLTIGVWLRLRPSSEVVFNYYFFYATQRLKRQFKKISSSIPQKHTPPSHPFPPKAHLTATERQSPIPQAHSPIPEHKSPIPQHKTRLPLPKFPTPELLSSIPQKKYPIPEPLSPLPECL